MILLFVVVDWFCQIVIPRLIADCLLIRKAAGRPKLLKPYPTNLITEEAWLFFTIEKQQRRDEDIENKKESIHPQIRLYF
jgi:hypothetical protein